MNDMLNLIKSSDFIGIKPGLVIDKSKRFTTVFGGILSLLVAVGLILSALFFSQDLVFYKYPNETRSVNYSVTPPSISIKNRDFLLELKDENGKSLNPDYYDISLNEISKADCSYSSSEINDTDNLLIFNQICTSGKTDNNFFNMNDNYRYLIKNISFDICKLDEAIIKNHKLSQTSKTLCLKENEHTSLLGNENGYLIRDLYLSIFPCNKNQTKCPKDYMDYFQKNKEYYVRIMYDNHIYNQKSYNDIIYSYPDQIILNQLDGRISHSTIIFKNIEINTDIGYIFEDFKSEKVIIKSEDYFKIFNYNDNIPLILTGNSITENNMRTGVLINMKLSPFYESIFRKYTKVQRILAEVGGLFKFFMVCALIVNYFQDKSSYYEKLFNELFNIDDLQKYFQYYEKDSKESLNNYRRIRNSIALKGIKQEEFIKKINKMISDENHMKENSKQINSKTKEDDENIALISKKFSKKHVRILKFRL